jgi:hypothetical protein
MKFPVIPLFQQDLLDGGSWETRKEEEPLHPHLIQCVIRNTTQHIYDGCTTYCDNFYHLPVVGSIDCYINAAAFAHLLL